MFHLFRSDESTHIPGHKEQTQDKEIISYDPDFVYIPCEDRRGNPLSGLLPIGTEVKKGTLLGKLRPDCFPIYSSVSGKITGRQKRRTSAGIVLNCFVIENDHKNEWTELKTLSSAENCSGKTIVDAIKESGVVGFSGTGFPAFQKFNFGKPVNYLIVNAIECEPFLTTDYVYCAKNREYLFLGLPYLLKASGAKKVAFCTKKNMPSLIEKCQEMREKYSSLPVELVLTKDAYPRGYERNLVTLITGKEYGDLPIEAGCIVDNIYTLISLGRYFTEGKVADRRCITISGEVANPVNILSPYGVYAKELLALAKFTPNDSLKILNGGPRTGNELADDRFILLHQADGITVLKKNNLRAEPCRHCGNCCEACPRDLQPVQIQMAYLANDLHRRIGLEADRCCECGLCSYQCPSRIEVSQNVRKAKTLVIQAKKEEKR